MPIHAEMELPLYETTIPTGFPSLTEEYLGDTMDINQYLSKNPTVSFLPELRVNVYINHHCPVNFQNPVIYLDVYLEF
jgi:hypothetical protein